MKWMIYILLLANLAFGLWSYRSQELASTNAPGPSENDNLRLVLVKEFRAQQNKPPTTNGNAETSGNCYTLGPFKAVDDADKVRQELKQAGLTARRRSSTDTTRKGFWVLLPPAASHAAARKIIDELKAKGIKDYFLVATGDQTNAVSLGVFSQSDTAQRRFEQLVELGFKPVLQKVNLPKREYWLDWPVEENLDTALLNKIRKHYSGIGQATRSCGNDS
ncbi:MAG: SPOR domain-containing protein [Gammaproteobacteria bacterium]